MSQQLDKQIQESCKPKKLIKCSNCQGLHKFLWLIAKDGGYFETEKQALKARFRICETCRNEEYGFCVDCNRLLPREKIQNNENGSDCICEYHFNSQYDGEF